MKRLTLLLLLLLASCSSPDKDAKVDAVGPSIGPDDPQNRFWFVADAMVYKCGTLDCHGNVYRNMRLYGYGGLRVSVASDVLYEPEPGKLYKVAMPDEVKKDYDAIIGLEPTIMADVVRDNGAAPERLLLIRKGRALENHKGGPVMKPGDSIDTCITSWLAANVNVESCKTAVTDLGNGTTPPGTP
jgi:hypothetical protein